MLTPLLPTPIRGFYIAFTFAHSESILHQERKIKVDNSIDAVEGTW